MHQLDRGVGCAAFGQREKLSLNSNNGRNAVGKNNAG
jgi:hypothetical protein